MVLLVGGLVVAASARAQITTGRIDQAAEAPPSAPVYVDPDAERALSERGGGTPFVLADFVRRVGECGTGAPFPTGRVRTGGGFPGAVLLALLAVPTASFGWSRCRRRKQERAELAEVREVARDDVIALGEDIRALDLDMEMAKCQTSTPRRSSTMRLPSSATPRPRRRSTRPAAPRMFDRLRGA